MCAMNTSRSKLSKKCEFVWTDNKAEFLLNATHDYKVQQLVDGMFWKSMRSKYMDIVELFRNKLSVPEEEAGNMLKDTLHT